MYCPSTICRSPLHSTRIYSDGLAVSRSAPKIFLRTSRSGLPYVSVAFCACFSLLAYMAIGNSSGIVFSWFSSMVATCGLTTWFGIGVVYLRFYNGLRAQSVDRNKLPYASRLQPYAAWWVVCASAVTMFVRFIFPRFYHT